MKLENNFTIDAPVEKAWQALNNPETVAPCFPGATLTSYEGDSFAGTVKVKLGPIAMTYKGKGTYVSRDEAAHEVVIEANGRDSRGNGTANATVTASLAAEGADKTAVSMVTDMTITGKPAQFGRGVIADVADKIIGQFAACVARKLAPAAEVAADEPVAVSAAASEATSDIATSPPRRTRRAAASAGRLRGDLGHGVGAGVDERGRGLFPGAGCLGGRRTRLRRRRSRGGARYAGDARGGDLRGGGAGVRGRRSGSGDRPAGDPWVGDLRGGGAGVGGHGPRPRDDGSGDDPVGRGPHRGGSDDGRYRAACSGAQRGRRDRPARPRGRAGAPAPRSLCWAAACSWF